MSSEEKYLDGVGLADVLTKIKNKFIANGGLTKSMVTTALGYTPPQSDDKVTQTNSTTNADYRVLLSNSASDTEETSGAKKSSNLLFNPSTGIMTANDFKLPGGVKMSDLITGNVKTKTVNNVIIRPYYYANRDNSAQGFTGYNMGLNIPSMSDIPGTVIAVKCNIPSYYISSGRGTVAAQSNVFFSSNGTVGNFGTTFTLYTTVRSSNSLYVFEFGIYNMQSTFGDLKSNVTYYYV